MIAYNPAMTGSVRQFTQRLLKWYDRERRELPWRTARGTSGAVDPYRVMVSEAMLQQTQVATVVPYFERFVQEFAGFRELAEADEQRVLRLWQGLGYYSRARNLQRAAKVVMDEHAGRLPASVEALRRLPGVGRYTAGAVASIAFDCKAPIVDGNVARVVCRLDRIETDPREKATVERLWRRAEELLPGTRCGDFNSALMELGATVCTPRSPKCLLCPVSAHCEAFSAGVQERIPPPRTAKPTPLVLRDVVCVRHGDCWLIEQRPAKGRWAGMWQFVTVPTVNGSPVIEGVALSGRAEQIGEVEHALTHRRYRFRVFRAAVKRGSKIGETNARKWVTLDELSHFPLPRPHVKIAAMLQTGAGATTKTAAATARR